MDHTRLDIRTTSISCGVLELNRISDETSEAIFALANYVNHPSRGEPAAFCIASDVTDSETATSKFMAEMVRCGLGSVSEVNPQINPKTGNPITVYTITLNHEALRKYYISRKIEKLRSKKH